MGRLKQEAQVLVEIRQCVGEALNARIHTVTRLRDMQAQGVGEFGEDGAHVNGIHPYVPVFFRMIVPRVRIFVFEQYDRPARQARRPSIQVRVYSDQNMTFVQ